jgi:hypothetical protein
MVMSCDLPMLIEQRTDFDTHRQPSAAIRHFAVRVVA